jgi:uncharacterized protein DUF4397
MTPPFTVAAIATALALLACNEQPHSPFTPPAQTGRLRFVHASPDTIRAKTVDVAVDGLALGTGIGYRGIAGYATALPAAHQVRALKGGDTLTLITADVTVATGADYTVLATGTDTDIQPASLADNNAAPPADSIRLRILHASPTAGVVDVYITAPGADLSAETPEISGMAFRDVGPYFTLPAGTHQVRYTTAGTLTVLLAVSTGALTSGRIRTVIALDKAGGGTPLTSAILSDR